MKLPMAAKILAADLALFLVLGFLLTPAGQLETRSPSKVTVLGTVTLVVYFVGLFAAIVALVFLFRRSRRAPLLAVIAGVLYFPVMLADQTRAFSSLRPPAAIAGVEWVEAIVALAAVSVGGWMTRRNFGATAR
jgi:hypothetical protein